MELNTFTIDDILKLDLQSKEVMDWVKLCKLYGINAATFEPAPESILENFIRKYPPEKYRWDHLNMVSILGFGLAYFNREKILDDNINLDELKTAFLKEKKFCDEVLYSYFQDKFNDYGDNNDPVEGTINNILKDVRNSSNSAWLRIKSEHDALKLKESLDEKQGSKVKKPKI